MMSVRLSVRLKISVYTSPIGLYSSENLAIGPIVVLSYFLGGVGTQAIPPIKININQPKYNSEAASSVIIRTKFVHNHEI